MFTWLQAYNPEYRETRWSPDAAAALFGNAAGSAEVALQLPTVYHEKADEDADLGPAPAQLGQATEESETTSGFIGAAPSINIAASIEAAVARAAEVGPVRPGAPPVFVVQGECDALSEFETGYYSAAFPEIFLDGKAELHRTRKTQLDEREWLEHLMWSGGGSAARHKVFCFVAWSMLQRHQCLNQGGFFVSSKFGDEPVPVEELREQLGRGDTSLARSVFWWGANLRGSDAYMHGLKREIDALIAFQIHRHSRLPTFFLTMSCAEFYWSDPNPNQNPNP